jgi:hypothetical protein
MGAPSPHCVPSHCLPVCGTQPASVRAHVPPPACPPCLLPSSCWACERPAAGGCLWRSVTATLPPQAAGRSSPHGGPSPPPHSRILCPYSAPPEMGRRATASQRDIFCMGPPPCCCIQSEHIHTHTSHVSNGLNKCLGAPPACAAAARGRRRTHSSRCPLQRGRARPATRPATTTPAPARACPLSIVGGGRWVVGGGTRALCYCGSCCNTRHAWAHQPAMRGGGALLNPQGSRVNVVP